MTGGAVVVGGAVVTVVVGGAVVAEVVVAGAIVVGSDVGGCVDASIDELVGGRVVEVNSAKP